MNKDNFHYTSLANQVFFGKEKINVLPELLEPYKKIFVIASSRFSRQVIHLKKQFKGELIRFEEVIQHVPIALVEKAIKQYNQKDCEILVAIGGGSAIGLAKAIAKENEHKIIAMPTTYSGSEATNIWGVSRRDGGKTTGRSKSVLPSYVIYDPDLTITLPPKLAAMSAMNAMAHLMEALYAPENNPITYNNSLYGMKQIMIGLHLLAKEQKLSESANKLFLLGSLFAGKGLGEVAMSLHHKAAHVLGGSFGLNHAQVHTVLQSYVLAYQWDALPNMMKEDMKKAMMHPYPPLALMDMAKVIDIPYSLKQLDFDKNNIEKAVDLILSKPYANPKPITKDGLMKMMEKAYVGQLEV